LDPKNDKWDLLYYDVEYTMMLKHLKPISLKSLHQVEIEFYFSTMHNIAKPIKKNIPKIPEDQSRSIFFGTFRRILELYSTIL